MILLDVYIPALSLSVDVRTKETGTVKMLTGEICDLIRQKTGENEDGDEIKADGFALYSSLQKRILPEDLTLRECGLVTGSSVELI